MVSCLHLHVLHIWLLTRNCANLASYRERSWPPQFSLADSEIPEAFQKFDGARTKYACPPPFSPAFPLVASRFRSHFEVPLRYKATRRDRPWLWWNNLVLRAPSLTGKALSGYCHRWHSNNLFFIYIHLEDAARDFFTFLVRFVWNRTTLRIYTLYIFFIECCEVLRESVNKLMKFRKISSLPWTTNISLRFASWCKRFENRRTSRVA